MPNVNQILPFATGAQARVLDPAAYQALAARVNGFVAGVADEQQLNTVWRQSSFVASMIGQFITDRAAVDVLDNGDITALEASFIKAIAAVAAADAGVKTTIYQTIAQSASGKGSWSRNVAGTYTWTCPANVYAVQATVIGAGGGGGASAPEPASNASIYAGEGGAGGGTAQDTISVVPGATYTIVVGAGGPAGQPGAGGTGGTGGTSAFSSFLTGTGGQGGRVASYGGGTPLTFGRTPGSGSGARVLNLSGGYGGVVTSGASQAVPGPGGSAQFGGQGGVISTTSGSPGSSPGGGGAGSAGQGVIAGQAGADGAVSLVYL